MYGLDVILFCLAKHGSCIDKNTIEEIIGCKIDVLKDKNQRSECGCVESVDEIEEVETLIEEVETRLYNIRQEKISGDNVYQFLLFFDKLYDRFTDIEKKTFMKSFLADVNIYEEEQAD